MHWLDYFVHLTYNFRFPFLVHSGVTADQRKARLAHLGGPAPMIYGFGAPGPFPGGQIIPEMPPVLPHYPQVPLQRPEYMQGTWTDHFLFPLIGCENLQSTKNIGFVLFFCTLALTEL